MFDLNSLSKPVFNGSNKKMNMSHPEIKQEMMMMDVHESSGSDHDSMELRIPKVLPVFQKEPFNGFHSSIRVVNNSEPPQRLPDNILQSILPNAFVVEMDKELQKKPNARCDIQNLLN